ncbi:MAG: UbiA family prenyltransferase [Candidatus Bathyarchaeota archaeon]|nr:UbiA family prenyltransferase [Candidatus Bathyarchaeum tardum]WNZ28837.1 MAG: UbiA family prenyltransferase [Candidatus Bathyarchaeota archaeon]
MGKLKGFIQIIRPLNCLMMGFAVIVGASLVSDLSFNLNLLFAFLTAFTLTGASMVVNDYYDRKIDAINEPNRPIPRGDVSPRQALVYALILSVLGLLAAYLTNLSSLAVAIAAWIISMTYITKGKSTGLPGNFLVSATVVIPFIYGGLAVGQLQTSTLLFVAIVFFSNTGREITKGIVDVEGDKSHNIKTIAVTFGEKNAAIAATMFSLIAVTLSPLPWLWGLVSDWFLPAVIITDIGLVISAVMLLKDYSRSNAKKIKNMHLAWFITGLVAFIMGTI